MCIWASTNTVVVRTSHGAVRVGGSATVPATVSSHSSSLISSDSRTENLVDFCQQRLKTNANIVTRNRPHARAARGEHASRSQTVSERHGGEPVVIKYGVARVEADGFREVRQGCRELVKLVVGKSAAVVRACVGRVEGERAPVVGNGRLEVSQLCQTRQPPREPSQKPGYALGSKYIDINVFDEWAKVRNEPTKAGWTDLIVGRAAVVVRVRVVRLDFDGLRVVGDGLDERERQWTRYMPLSCPNSSTPSALRWRTCLLANGAWHDGGTLRGPTNLALPSLS